MKSHLERNALKNISHENINSTDNAKTLAHDAFFLPKMGMSIALCSGRKQEDHWERIKRHSAKEHAIVNTEGGVGGQKSGKRITEETLEPTAPSLGGFELTTATIGIKFNQ